MPCDRSIRATLDVPTSGTARRAELPVLTVQQILPDEREIEVRRRLPGERGIQLGIRRYQLIVDVIDRPEPGGEAQVRRQIHRRLQEELGIGSRGLPRAPGHVGAAGVGPAVDAQLGVAGVHPPPVCEPVLGSHFGSIGLTVLPVGDHNGDGESYGAEVTAEYWLT